MARSITVTFKSGAVTIETAGYQGAECLDATRALEAQLGIGGLDETTSEFCLLPVTDPRTRY